MRITFEGREWEFDLEAITLKQGIAIHLAYGFNLDQWFTALSDTDPRALQCLWWLILQQDGQVLPLKDADCSLIELSVAFADAEVEEPEAEPDPTPPSPSSPPGGPLSSGPSTPTATTRPRAARRRPQAVESTPPI